MLVREKPRFEALQLSLMEGLLNAREEIVVGHIIGWCVGGGLLQNIHALQLVWGIVAEYPCVQLVC